MTNLSKITLSILALTTTVSCKKTHDDISSKLELLQHKWAVVSLSGEALHYSGTAGDYYNFSSDNFLYRHVATMFDTSYYQFSPTSDDTILLYPVTNHIRSNSSIHFYINSLSATQLILSTSTVNPPIYAIDSLKR
jgi:hypothetical protein